MYTGINVDILILIVGADIHLQRGHITVIVIIIIIFKNY